MSKKTYVTSCKLQFNCIFFKLLQSELLLSFFYILSHSHSSLHLLISPSYLFYVNTFYTHASCIPLVCTFFLPYPHYLHFSYYCFPTTFSPWNSSSAIPLFFSTSFYIFSIYPSSLLSQLFIFFYLLSFIFYLLCSLSSRTSHLHRQNQHIY